MDVASLSKVSADTLVLIVAVLGFLVYVAFFLHDLDNDHIHSHSISPRRSFVSPLTAWESIYRWSILTIRSK